MRLPFVKMSGAGNDFVVIDHETVSDLCEEALSRLALQLCRRRIGVGADGLILVEPLSPDAVRMVYLNADGSRAAMCGNGARCAARYAFEKGWVGERLTVEADDGPHPASVQGSCVKLGMRDPRVLDEQVEMRFGERVFPGIWMDTGVPHLVLWVNDVAAVDVDSAGRGFRFDERFAPGGTNVDFAQFLGPSVLKVRTYERGVESETLACGTGVVAAAVGAYLQRSALPPLEVRAVGGTLRVTFRCRARSVEEVTLIGDAASVFEGVLGVGDLGGPNRPCDRSCPEVNANG